MRSFLLKLLSSALLLVLLSTTMVGQTPPSELAAKQLVERFGDLKAAGAAVSVGPESMPTINSEYRITSAAYRRYVAKDGQRFLLIVMTADSDAAAYARFTNARREHERAASEGRIPKATKPEVGVESFASPEQVSFVKGQTFVTVTRDDAKVGQPKPVEETARAFDATLDSGQGDIPVLIRHLPDWQNVRQHIEYAVDQQTLKRVFANQAVFDAVSFHGGAEAVIADYQGPKLVIVEFNTPQIATDNNGRINARIEELRSQGQPSPTAYRRVGNYSVFVFDAANEQAANQLIDQVKYQQIVQWLGENPYRYDEAVKEFTQTTLGVFVSVVKASGLVILGSLALGGFLGALLFSRRRAQQQAVAAYSDAGGMLRLNLDEMTPRVDPARLLGPGN